MSASLEEIKPFLFFGVGVAVVTYLVATVKLSGDSFFRKLEKLPEVKIIGRPILPRSSKNYIIYMHDGYIVYDFKNSWIVPEKHLPPGTYWFQTYYNAGVDYPDPSPPIESVKEFEDRIKRGLIIHRTPLK